MALQAGFVFNTLTRFGMRAGFGVPAAAAGTLLLLLPHRYLIEPIVVFGFYSQVVAQTFAVGMLWGMVAWHQEPSRPLLALAGVFGVGVVLCWPVYFPAASLAVGFAVAIAYFRRERRLRASIVDLSIAVGPAAIAVVIFSARHASSAGILQSGGAVLVPSVAAFRRPFLVIAAAGLVVALRHARTTAPVLAFAAACAVQIAALAVAQTMLGATNLYLANKTVFLLVVPLTVMGGLALGAIFGARSQSRLTPALLHWAPLILVSLLVAFSGLPLRPLESPLTQPVYRAGLWAKTHVPAPCVDYFVDHWITGYWLHLDVLGNARASERMGTETFEQRSAVSGWILPGGLPFAIVENLQSVPVDARQNMDVLHEAGTAAVVRRTDGRGACPDKTPPIDYVGNAAPR